MYNRQTLLAQIFLYCFSMLAVLGHFALVHHNWTLLHLNSTKTQMTSVPPYSSLEGNCQQDANTQLAQFVVSNKWDTAHSVVSVNHGTTTAAASKLCIIPAANSNLHTACPTTYHLPSPVITPYNANDAAYSINQTTFANLPLVHLHLACCSSEAAVPMQHLDYIPSSISLLDNLGHIEVCFDSPLPTYSACHLHYQPANFVSIHSYFPNTDMCTRASATATEAKSYNKHNNTNGHDANVKTQGALWSNTIVPQTTLACLVEQTHKPRCHNNQHKCTSAQMHKLISKCS